MRSKVIKFTKIIPVHDSYAPIPAKKDIPDWYKEMQSYITGEKKLTNQYVNLSP